MKRILDIAIASIIGAVLGGYFASHIHPGHLSVGTLQADNIRVPGELGEVTINGNGIRLDRDDYAYVRLGYADGSKGGPSLWIVGLEHTAFKATPSGQEVVHFKSDEKDGL
jgi:hypothetical protein